MLECAAGPAHIGEDVRIGRYVTPDTIRLGISGLAAGLAAGLAWRAGGRTRWGATPVVVAVLTAGELTRRLDWPHWSGMVAAGAVVTILAGVGAAELLAECVDAGWVLAGALISAAGVWAAVPETGPALLAACGILGLVVMAVLSRARWAPTAGVGVAAVLGWAALSGAAGRPWAAVGGALCTGVAPWFALRHLVSAVGGIRRPGPWLLGAHLVLVILAARWIGVNPHAGWGRIAIVAFAGMAVAIATRGQA